MPSSIVTELNGDIAYSTLVHLAPLTTRSLEKFLTHTLNNSEQGAVLSASGKDSFLPHS
jgi:hypothetical protein